MSADTGDLGERLTGVENAVEQMNERFGDLNSRIDRLDDRMESRFDRLGGRIDDLDAKMDSRSDTLDGKIDDQSDQLNRKIEQAESRMLQRMTVLIGVATVILVIVQIWIA
jgi:chromosome segregation ATPase